MNMQANISSLLSTQDGIEDEKDVLGGSGPLDSGVYPMTVDLAYLETSSGGAMGLTLHFVGENNTRHRETLWMTSGTAKGGKNYYERDGEKRYLPGFIAANALGLLTVGKEIGELAQVAEERVVKLYSFEEKKEVPTKVPVLLELLNQDVTLGILRQTVDKNAKGDDGKYYPTGETRDESIIDKVFRSKDGMTTAEIRAGAEEAVFINTWREKNTGVTRDRSKGVSGQAGAPKATGNTKKPTKSLFASE